jgi:phenylacetate-CoA ligase
MRLLEISRKYAFWLLDFLKGGKVRKHYRDIMLVLNHASSNEASQRQGKNLSAILRHAVTTTQFYKQKNGYRSLNDFAVINKSIVRESFDSFISSGFDKSELISVVTSGSTGTPFKVYHDKNKKLRNSADTIFFAQMAGYDLGYKLVYMKIFVKDKMKNPVSYWMENTIPVDVIRLNETQIEGLLRRMENNKSTYTIIGYSSALELVCKYLEKKKYGGVNANVKSVIAMSETLNDYTKETMQKYFSALVVSRYSNLENGIIAQQETAGSGRYLINTASYVVEILKMDSDEQAEPRQTGRIVVTDLFNYGMPLIRYDTGDIGAISQDSGKKRNMYLANVEGRKLDMLYDTKGNLVSSYMVYKNMWQFTEIIQYQLIQEGRKEYTLKINADGTFTKEAKIIKEFKEYLGKDAVFTVEYVSEIPLLSSGKRKMIVNNYL